MPALDWGGWGLRRIAGVAGLGYFLGVAIENMEVLGAPTLGSPADEIRAQYADEAFGVVTGFAGALALLFYVVFVVALFGLLREREQEGEGWALIGLVGGVAGPVVAAAGLAADATLIANGGAGFSGPVVEALLDFYLSARMVSGLFVALFLLGVGVAALRSGVLPRWLAWAALAIAVPMTFAPLAAFTAAQELEVVVTIAFGIQTLWIFLLSLRFVLANGVALATLVRRGAFLVLVLAAGLGGIALLAVPGATGSFFAWGLDPEPLAAFAGGVYVGAAVLYAVAFPVPWPQVRALVAAAVVLSVSVFVITLAHTDVFDFDRMQAWAWVVLFAAFSLIMIGILALTPQEGRRRKAVPLEERARLAFGIVAGLLGLLALALWIDPTWLSGASPFDLPPLGGRFAGSWIALLAFLSGWAAVRNRRDEAWLPALALLALPAGALLAALRTVSDLESGAAGAAYAAMLTVLVALGVALLLSTWPDAPRAAARRRRAG